MTHRAFAFCILSLATSACTSTVGYSGGTDGGTSDSGTSQTDSGTGDGSIPATDGAIATGPSAFRLGVNPGYYGPGIDRRESAMMSANAGANSMRTKLTEPYLAMWGDDIEVGDWEYYSTLGIDHLACFLIGATREHSTAPLSAQDWELEHYAPANLYEPIFLSNGDVNPNNYWASFVDRVSRNYGEHLDIYEVWNEPDQVLGNWTTTTDWDTRAPTAEELPWWNASIFAYIRALRITHEIVQRNDPTGRVTVGGVGYSTFLSALLRYTDEPTAGAVTTEFPETGGAYLDVVSYHFYPVFGGGSSDTGADNFLAARDELAGVVSAAGEGTREYVVTENGAPRYALGTYPGGTDYSASYLIKTMTLGHYEGLLGIDWFAQGDGAAESASTDSFDYMGLYFNYASATTPGETHISPQGAAYAWLATWFVNLAPDHASLASLSLPSNVRGAAFTKDGGGHLYVLWARTSGDESATATFSLAASSDVTVHSFSTTSGPTTNTQAPTSGYVQLSLTGMPIAIETF